MGGTVTFCLGALLVLDLLTKYVYPHSVVVAFQDASHVHDKRRKLVGVG